MVRLKSIAPYLAIVAVYAGLRLIDLSHIAHSDERLWLGRSLNFLRALQTREFAYTYQMQHPGVMTMWAGAIAYLVRYPDVLSHVTGNNDIPSSYVAQMWSWGMEPPEVLIALRASKVIMQTFFFALALRYLHPLVGRSITILTGSLIAVSGTLVGWDSWLHLDGLAGITAFAGIVATVYAAETTDLLKSSGKRTHWNWFIAGAICATSWLTRSTSLLLVMVPALALLLLLISQHTTQPEVSLRHRCSVAAGHGLTWAAGAMVSTFLLFPALWVNPVDTIRAVIGMPVSGAMGNGPENFFPEDLADPGWSYYPNELILRTTPFEWIGIVALVLISYHAWRRNLLGSSALRLSLLLIVFVVIFVVAISFSPKKGERYVMTVYPILTLLASTGLVALYRLLAARFSVYGRVLGTAICVVAISYSAVTTLQSLPYKYVYNNPITLAVTGEERSYAPAPGYDQVADYLLSLDESEATTVGVTRSAWASVLGYFIPPEEPIEFVVNSTVETPAEWAKIDYQMVAVNYDADSGQSPYYPAVPVHKVSVDGQVLWEIYHGMDIPVPRTVLTPSACTYSFGKSTTLYQVESADDALRLYLIADRAKPVTVEVFANVDGEQVLLGRQDLVPIKSRVMMIGEFDSPGAANTPYEITIYVYDTETGEKLSATPYEGTESTDHATVETDCYDASTGE
ncbi:MAG: hypothetical protein KC435_10720 [Thermomicrobiales bacterium]|nr:hypothetical protein [Thermomicrobiales bacterium]